MRNAMFGVLFLLLVGIASADVVTSEMTAVCGNVYINGSSEVIEGARVDVECVGPQGSYFGKGMSGKYSDYCIFFQPSECTLGDSVFVNVTYFDDQGYFFNGYVGGTVNGTAYNPVYNVVMDFAAIDVPLVPEFGFIVGMVTILGAVGIFFVVRKD